MTQWEAVMDVIVGGGEISDGGVVVVEPDESDVDETGIGEDGGAHGQPGEDCPF